MHVASSNLRVLRQDGIVLRFASFESMAFVVTETPDRGSAGSWLEQPCVKPHWGYVISGELAIEAEGRRRIISSGTAFHVPSVGRPHRFEVGGAARIAGFEPVDDLHDASDAALVKRGYELLTAETLSDPQVIPVSVEPLIQVNRIEARTWSMSSLVLTQARFGPASGYTTAWCDAPHWGVVTFGRLAIESEDDMEILSPGDVYHIPGGRPGHRLEAADPAAVLDLTPIEAFGVGRRIAAWRTLPSESVEASPDAARIAVVPLD